MLRHAHFYIKGGERKFAAGANWIGQLEESGRSGLRPSVFDFQVQLTAAVSPSYHFSASQQKLTSGYISKTLKR
jgi:hypothetical protein